MTTHPMDPIRSEKGMALIIVLLLLAVMAGLTTGLTLNGQTEIAMATNEAVRRRARGCRGGMNRAIQQITNPTNNTINLLTTPTIPAIGNGPFNLTAELHRTPFMILDDDDPSSTRIPSMPTSRAGWARTATRRSI